jgi:hypothetical protein
MNVKDAAIACFQHRLANEVADIRSSRMKRSSNVEAGDKDEVQSYSRDESYHSDAVHGICTLSIS